MRVGGTDVRDMPTSQLMEQLSMVFQDVYLFDDTLDANIRIGNPSADDDQVRWAADLAGVTEIVDRMPHGWDTRVGERGQDEILAYFRILIFTRLKQFSYSHLQS